jgi:hypothetical protein
VLVQYSVSKTNIYAYTYPFRSYQSSGYYQSSTSYGDSFEYMSPSKDRTMVEFDLTNTINSIVGQAFVWDWRCDHWLDVQLTSTWYSFPMSSVTGCRVL